MSFLWVSYGFPMGFLWVSYKIPIGSYWFLLPAAPPARHRSLPAAPPARHRSLQPAEPAPHRGRNSDFALHRGRNSDFGILSEKPITGPAPKVRERCCPRSIAPRVFFSPFTRPAVNPGVGTGLLTQSWRGHRIARKTHHRASAGPSARLSSQHG